MIPGRHFVGSFKRPKKAKKGFLERNDLKSVMETDTKNLLPQ
jgi:hypothetical protein